MINGINNLVITKLDVLTGIENLKIVTHYKTEDGKIIDYFTSSTEKLYNYEPIYQDLPGWRKILQKQEAMMNFLQTLRNTSSLSRNI
jgi:adenylosuccinate synthase